MRIGVWKDGSVIRVRCGSVHVYYICKALSGSVTLNHPQLCPSLC